MDIMSDRTQLINEFQLTKEVTQLNFGSFGACPLPVFETYQTFQRDLEYEPVPFITKRGPALLIESRNALANYIGADAENILFTQNPTYAINILAASLGLKEGDEVLSTNLEYGALDNTWDFYCTKFGAKYIKQNIQLPLVSREQFEADFWKGFSDKTKIVFISQMTSMTGLILPVKEICAEAKKRGLITIVDGAHIPGHIPLNLKELEADFYTGACHKWMMTPKGSSFLMAKQAFHDRLDPLVVSWGYNKALQGAERFASFHQFNGTRDFSAYLTIPSALAFMKKHNWESVSQECKSLAQSNYLRFCNLLNTQPLAPITNEFLGQLCSIPIQTDDAVALKEKLYSEYQIEIPVMQQNGKTYLRYSVQVYNTQQDLDKLYSAVEELIKTGEIIPF